MPLSRSENMARIRGRDTRPERLLCGALVDLGLALEPQPRTPHGRPDLRIVGKPVLIFLDGCFWHGCPEHYARPSNREAFWAERLRSNVARDRRQTLALEAEGWTVVRIWEHEVFTGLPAVVERVRAACAGEPARAAPDWQVEQVDVLDPLARIERRCLVGLRDPTERAEVVGKRSTRGWRQRHPQGSIIVDNLGTGS